MKASTLREQRDPLAELGKAAAGVDRSLAHVRAAAGYAERTLKGARILGRKLDGLGHEISKEPRSIGLQAQAGECSRATRTLGIELEKLLAELHAIGDN